MRVGLLGPAGWSDRLDEFASTVDVFWGTDDPLRAVDHMTAPPRIDALIVHGSAEFVTSSLIDKATTQSIPVYVLAKDEPVNAWIDLVENVRRISQISDIPQNDSESVSSDDASKRAGVPRGAVVAVWGPVGSPGISTVAISVGALAAREGRSVLLCDADTRGSSLAIGLALVDDVPGFAAACRLAGRMELSEEHIHRLAIPVNVNRGKLSVLTGLPRASRWVEIAPPKCRDVVDFCRSLFDVVVIDVGTGIDENDWVDGAPQRDGAARALIANADCLVAVGASDAVGIARLIRALDEVTSLSESPVVVLNRTTRSSAREAKEAIERFTTHAVSATIAKDNRGGLEDAVSRAPGSAKSVWDMVRAVIDEPRREIER
ncbi:MAG: hypothetical protein RJA31_1118 [Actinomycetota bacterium]